MGRGLVLGKFMPLHKGHIELINFARCNCSKGLVVLVCHDPDAHPISGQKRLDWVRKEFYWMDDIDIDFTDRQMPDAPDSDREVSKVWAKYLKDRYPDVGTIFSSEPYGEYVAEYMGIKHVPFDPPREQIPISATEIRNNPMKYWNYIAESARSFFLKKVCIYGPESCGKSTLTQRLAEYFNTYFVPEVAREILSTYDFKRDMYFERHCEYDDIYTIGIRHASEILTKEKLANKVLFVDSDILTTKIYSQQYFNKTPEWPDIVYKTNTYDLYLLCTPEVPWVDDGTRDLGHAREEMYQKFKHELDIRKLPYIIIDGDDWEERDEKAIKAVEELIK